MQGSSASRAAPHFQGEKIQGAHMAWSQSADHLWQQTSACSQSSASIQSFHSASAATVPLLLRGILGTLGDEKALSISCSFEFFYLQGEASGDVGQCTDPLQLSKCREAKKSAFLRGNSCDDLQ